MKMKLTLLLALGVSSLCAQLLLIDTEFGNAGAVTLISETHDFSLGFGLTVDEQGYYALAGYQRQDPIGNIGINTLFGHLTPTGDLAPDFGGGDWMFPTFSSGIEYASRLISLPNGDWVWGGSRFTANGWMAPTVGRLLSDGTLDPAYGEGGLFSYLDWANAECTDLRVDHDDRLLQIGFQTTCTEPLTTQGFVARIEPTGILTTDFGDDGVVILSGNGVNNMRPQQVYLPTEDRILIVSNKEKIGAINSQSVQVDALQMNGVHDTSYGLNGVSVLGPEGDMLWVRTFDSWLDANQGLYIAGQIGYTDFSRAAFVVRLLPDGQLDTGFGTNGWLITDQVLLFDEVLVFNDRLLLAASHSDNLFIQTLFLDGTPDAAVGNGGWTSYPYSFFQLTDFQPNGSDKIALLGNFHSEEGKSGLRVLQFSTGLSSATHSPMDTRPGFRVYPNPASSWIQIEATPSFSSAGQVLLLDANGRVCHEFASRLVFGTVWEEALPADLPTGAYVISIIGDEASWSYPVLVRK
jgi:hypothetical protein